MYSGSLAEQRRTPLPKPSPSSEGLGVFQVIPIVILAALGVGGTAWGYYTVRGLLGEKERRAIVKEGMRQLMLSRPASAPAFIAAWPKFSELDRQLLVTTALELGLEVVTPTLLKGSKNVLLATSPTGSHVVVMQNPIDMAKVYSSNDVIDLASVNSVLQQALASKLPNAWFTQQIANDWAKKIQTSGSVTSLVLRSRPISWGFIDWMLLGGGLVAATYLGVRIYRKRSRKTSEGDILGGVASAFKNNPEGASEEEINRAIDKYRKFHWGEEPSKTEEYEVPDLPPVVNEHGKLIGVVYQTNKRGDGETVYVHQFDNPHPKLVSNNDWNQLYIVGGRYTIAPEGIMH